jgi:hypothetical protein
VAVLPAAAGLTGDAYLHKDTFSAGFRTASLISAGLCLGAGVLAAFTIRNPRRARTPVSETVPDEGKAVLSCGLDSPPRRVVE